MSGPGAGEPGGPSEEELRAAYEAELSRISATDMIAQAAVSLLNIGAWRITPPQTAGQEGAPAQPAGRDLEQARDAIDAAGALLEILQRRIPNEIAPLRDALSRLQMAYAREVGPGSGEPEPAPQEPGAAAAGQSPGPEAGKQGEQGGEGEQQGERRPGPAESSGRLWVPGQ